MAAASPDSTTFADATAVKQLTSHTYSAHFPDDWCIGSVPHGGYVTSTFQTVAQAHFSTTLSKQTQPDTLSLHLDFLRRTSAGPALFTVKDVKLGRQTSIIHITLSQGPRVEVVGYITHTNIASEEGLSFQTGWALHPAPASVDLAALKQNTDAHWARRRSVAFSSFRKASQKMEFHFPRDGQVSRNIGDSWLRLSNGEKFTAATLGYVVDMFPMPIEAFLGDDDDDPYSVKEEQQGKPRKRRAARFWYPTLLLNLEVKKKLPEEGVEWLFSRCQTKSIKNGRADLEIVILDAGGDIVALSHHVTFALPAERNLAKRSDGAESKI